MKCKNCGMEIPDNAKFCDVCGMPVKREVGTRIKKKKRQIPIIPIFIVLGFVFFVVYGVSSFVGQDTHLSYTQEEQKLSDNSCRVTADMFYQIDDTMSHDEIIKVFGTDGVKTYHSSNRTEYTWPGEYYGKLRASEPKVRITFYDDTGKIDSIEEVNVVDGKEIYENEKSGRDAVTKLTEKELTGLPAGASYETICDLMGSEGVLINSMRIGNSVDKSYVWRYLSKDNKYEDAYLTFTDNRYDGYL